MFRAEERTSKSEAEHRFLHTCQLFLANSTVGVSVKVEREPVWTTRTFFLRPPITTTMLGWQVTST
jgi:hypothetical protein